MTLIINEVNIVSLHKQSTVGVSPRTLEKHVAKLKHKLCCKNITSLVVELRKYFL